MTKQDYKKDINQIISLLNNERLLRRIWIMLTAATAELEG